VVNDRAPSSTAPEEQGPLSPRVARLLTNYQRQLAQPALDWPLDHLLNDPLLEAMPPPVRQVRRLAILLARLPIALEADELVVGSTAIDGRRCRPTLPIAPATDWRLAEQLLALDVEVVLRQGLQTRFAQLAERAAQLDAAPASLARQTALIAVQVAWLTAEALLHLAQRYANLATRQATAAPPQRAAELRQIAALCRRVPAAPVRSFHEVCQVTWLLQHAIASAGGIPARLPLAHLVEGTLAADRQAGRLSQTAAQELADCLWLKLSSLELPGTGVLLPAQSLISGQPTRASDLFHGAASRLGTPRPDFIRTIE
jgi:hypothetical protein